ncbi:lipopolysaccharide biosynthesis protein [Sediminibacter sp. Hel_I_10]|uniref:lipopolysaccharide biosynthesis protein n=1 Tax=Sediminibacter sp. Hel_I_10 TaxID=1392490 RepID=UPI00047E6E6C|nr:lipopolysaccharide biosynthesis protein [Sediminibacter sp. Hel_I_10]
MSDNLGARSTIAFGWALGGQFSNQIIGFVITLVLARLLTPEEFGLASLVMVVNLFGQIFIDAGISSGLIRKKELNNTELSSFFFLNIFVGLLLMFLVYVTSAYIALLFESESLRPLLQLSSLQFFISSLGLMPMIFLKRDINFRFLSQLDVGINVSSGIITILLAYGGFGVYSLIFRSIISGILNASFLWRQTSWRPSWVFSYESIKPTLNYSTGILGLEIVGTLFDNFSTILIGKVFSVSTVGIYNRAANTRGLVLKNFGPLFNKVFFPVLSKIQDDEVRLQSYYLKAIQMVSLLVVFAMAMLFLFSDTLIYYLYGKQWMGSAPMLKILAIAGLVLPISNINLNLFMVKGKSRFLMGFTMGKNIFGTVVMLVAIKFGMTYFLYSLVCIAYIFFFLNIFVVYKKLNFPIQPQITAFTSKLIPALILVSLIELFILPNEVSLTYTLLIAPIFSSLYFVIVFLIDKELYFLIKNMITPKFIQLKAKLSRLF